MRHRIVIFIATLLLTMITSGCSTLSYYTQSVKGQWQIMTLARPIAELLEESDTPPELKLKLQKVLQMREFAVVRLGLPDNASYKRYADLGRSHVVWNVFAAPELSVEPVSWCFPIVGCLIYRGYFSERDAREFSDQLKEQGYDTIVGGISAYSTLGWFNDPVLNTFVDRSDAELAGLVFHELSHQVIYIKGDTVFNESLATAVELEGMRQWLEHTGAGEQVALERARLERRDQFIGLLLEFREVLREAYEQDQSDSWKREQKQEIIQAMREKYRGLANEWQYSGYDNWFAQPLNNAHFISAAAYHSRVPAFTELIRQTGSMAAFWTEVTRISQLSEAQRDSVLDSLAEKQQ